MPYKYNPLTKKLDYYEAGAESLTLDNINDVSAAGATQDQVLAYNSSSGTWTPATITASDSNAITEDTTYYVDGDSGNNSNDGSSWANAKKNLDFLYSDSSDAIPRELKADVTVNIRGDILSTGDTQHTIVDGFYGSGKLIIQGETTDSVTELTATGWNNTISDQEYHSYVTVAGAGWTTNAYRGMFLQLTSPASDDLYPIIGNSSDTLQSIGLPDLDGSSEFKIVDLNSSFKDEQIGNPGVTVPFESYNFINFSNINVPLVFSKIDFLSNNTVGYTFFSSGSGGKFLDSPSSYAVSFTHCKAAAIWTRDSSSSVFRRCYFDLTSYKVLWPSSESEVRGCCLYSSDGKGNGITHFRGRLYVYNIRTENQRYGIYGNDQSSIALRGAIIDDCATGILASGFSSIKNEGGFWGPLVFTDNVYAVKKEYKAIFQIGESCPVFSSGNTYDIRWNSDPDLYISFSDFLNGKKIGDGHNITNSAAEGISTPDAIYNDMDFYVDGTSGDDDNDGSSWANAKETLSFLYSKAPKSLPRKLGSGTIITVNVRGPVRGYNDNLHTAVDGFEADNGIQSDTIYYDEGAEIRIIGEETEEQADIVVTGYDNTSSSLTYHTYVDASGESWTPNEHIGRFIKFTTAPDQETLYPIIGNTATRLETVGVPDLSGSSRFSIISVPQFLDEKSSDPGVNIGYSYIIKASGNNGVEILFKNLDLYSDASGVSFAGIYSYGPTYVNVQQCSTISLWIQNTRSFYLTRSLIETLKNNWFALYSDGNKTGSFQLYDSALTNIGSSTSSTGLWLEKLEGGISISGLRIDGHDIAIKNKSSYLDIWNNQFIDNCTKGIELESGRISIGEFYGADLKIDSATNAIELRSGQLYVDASANFYGTNTNDIVSANNPSVTHTFADLSASNPIYNSNTGAHVIYIDASSASADLQSDYSNSSSGLSANTLQEAIDEIAGYTSVASDIDHNGFVNRTDSEYSFDDGLLRFSVGPKAPATEFSYYSEGTKYTKTGTDTVDITDNSGLWFIYYDGSTLTATQTWSDALILQKALVAIVNWSTTDAEANFIADERHGISMAPETHEHLHETIGTVWYNGLGLTNILSDESGDLDTHAQFGYGSGEIADEDNIFDIAVGTAPAQIPMFYRHGASGEWRRQTANNFPVINYSGGDNMLAWNEWTGATWQQTEVDDADFVLTHIYAVNDPDQPIIGIQGQAEYNRRRLARIGASEEASNLALNGLPTAEFKLIATVIFQTDATAYANSVKARIRTTDEGGDYIDWRASTATSSTGFVSDHGSLGGLTDDDHTQYLLADGTRNLDYLDLTTGGSAPSYSEGRMYYDEDNKTVSMQTSSSDVTLNIGQEQFIYAHNDTGTTITNGTAVYITGQSGGYPTIGRADYSSVATAVAIGIATEDIADGTEGHVSSFGLVRDIDTSSFAEGGILWLGTNGALQAARPSTPNFGIIMGICITSDATEGKAFAKVDIIPRLISLSDVRTSSLQDGDIIQWNNGASRFENNPGCINTEDTDVDSGGDEILDTLDASSFNAAFWEYVLFNVDSVTNKRAGTVTATWDEVAGTVRFFDSSTSDIGDTSDAVLSVTHNASTGEIQLVATMSTDNWTVKTKRRTL